MLNIQKNRNSKKQHRKGMDKMLIIFYIAAGVFLGILGWKAVKAGIKILVFLTIIGGILWLVGFLLQNLLPIYFALLGIVYIVYAIKGAPKRRAKQKQDRGDVLENIVVETAGKVPSVVFWGYHAPFYNPLAQKHFVVAKVDNMLWLIEIDPFTYDAINSSQIPVIEASIEIKRRIIGDKVIIKTPEKTIALNTGWRDRQEVRKLSDTALRSDSKVFSEEELQKTVYGQSPEDLVKQLKQWQKDPSSQPEIEYYYRNYTLQEKTLPRPLQKWEKEAEDYIPRLDEARSLEKLGDIEGALKVYLDIIEQYNPIGTVYYERPAIILERLGRLEQAISVCEKALANPYLEKSWSLFEKRLNRLKKKTNK